MPTKSHTSPQPVRTPRPGDATLTVARAARVLGVHPNTVRAWSEAGRLRYYRINERGDRRYRLGDLQRFLSAAEAPVPADVGELAPIRGPRRDGQYTLTETTAGLDLLADLAEIASFPSGLDTALGEACRRIRLTTGAALVGIWERRPGGLVLRATDAEGVGVTALRSIPPGRTLFARALESDQPVHARPGDPTRVRSSTSAPTSSSWPFPVAKLRGASWCLRGRWSWDPTTVAVSPRPSPGRWASWSEAPRPRSRPRRGFVDPKPCGASPPTSCHGWTWRTWSATSRITPGSCSEPTGWR